MQQVIIFMLFYAIASVKLTVVFIWRWIFWL